MPVFQAIKINETVRLIRKKTGLSQEEFAQSIGITRGLLSQIELGNSTPTLPLPPHRFLSPLVYATRFSQ